MYVHVLNYLVHERIIIQNIHLIYRIYKCYCYFKIAKSKQKLKSIQVKETFKI